MTADNKMKILTESVFVGEVAMQAKIALRAAERLLPMIDVSDQVEAWCSIQSILIAAGNVSKILWPSRDSSKERGEVLRNLLNADDFELLSSRKFRNHFEHYDERIEDWFSKNNSSVYMDSRIDPFGSVWGDNFSGCHRAYNPLTKILFFRGDSVNVRALVDELEIIRDKCGLFVLV